MAYGFKVLNNNGIVQIDENYSNYSLVASGSVTSPAPTYGPAPYYFHNNILRIFYTDYGAIPIIFIRSLASNRFVRLVSITNSYADIAIYESGYFTAYGLAGGLSATSNTFEYRVYSLQPLSGLNYSYGVNIFTNTGRASFSSNTKNMRVQNVHYITWTEPPSPVYPTQNVSISTSSSPWFSINSTLYSDSVIDWGYESSEWYMGTRLYNLTGTTVSMTKCGDVPQDRPTFSMYNGGTSVPGTWGVVPLTIITLLN